jgi:hypothetical protein
MSSRGLARRADAGEAGDEEPPEEEEAPTDAGAKTSISVDLRKLR